MSPFRPIGLDLSANAIGIARADGTTTTIRPRAGASDPARRIFEMVAALPQHLTGATFALIEGYALGGRFETMATIAEMAGAVKLLLFECSIAYDSSVRPTSLKKYATFNGRADKAEMVVAANAHGAGIEPGRHDEADAWWLRRICLDRVNGVVPSAIPGWDRYRAELIEGVRWP